MLTINFIFPSGDYLFNPFRGDPHTHFQILTWIAASCGQEVKTALTDLRGVRRKFAEHHIPQADLYLHSVYTLDFEEQKDLVSRLRTRYPAAKHVAGGPHPLFFREDCRQVFDALVLGDGEEAILDLIADLKRGALKPVYEQQGPIDVNRYPFPRRHWLPEASVARPGLINLKHRRGLESLLSTTAVFSRGCTHNCAFCAMPRSKRFNPGVRYRRPELIAEEIEYLKRDYGIAGINILDEIGIPPRKADALPHLEAIGRTGITWRAQCRVGGFDDETAALAAQSGCVTMSLGVESALQPCLDLINKGITVEQAKDTLRLLQKHGIETRVYMILGLPGETEDVVEKTWEFIRETDPVSVYLSLFTVRPGTPVFEEPERFGISWINRDWKKTMHMFSRYDKEKPELTFRYHEQAPWGRALDPERIVANYLELQQRIIEDGRGPL